MDFFDLRASNAEVNADLQAGFQRVLASGWVILGPEVEAFETEFASFCNAEHCISVANGLDALKLVLQAAGIGPGDEVIVPSHTFIATWLAVAATGASVVPVEVDETTYTLDPKGIAAAITSRTAAILPVSLYGHPVDMDPIMDIAQRHHLLVIEDAAQSHGARYRGRRVGSLAHATCFSFYPTKNLGALGDAGGIVTNDSALATKLRTLRNYGSREKYVHVEIGTNSRMDELQAAFLRSRLPRLDDWNARRIKIAEEYNRNLAHLSNVATPHCETWAEHVYHLYVVRVVNRESLILSLKQQGISTLIHYPIACHLQDAFKHLGFSRGAFPKAERLAQEVLSLPMWPQMPLTAPKQVALAIEHAGRVSARSSQAMP